MHPSKEPAIQLSLWHPHWGRITDLSTERFRDVRDFTEFPDSGYQLLLAASLHVQNPRDRWRLCLSTDRNGQGGGRFMKVVAAFISAVVLSSVAYAAPMTATHDTQR